MPPDNVGHQNPTDQSGTVCQIESRLIHFILRSSQFPRNRPDPARFLGDASLQHMGFLRYLADLRWHRNILRTRRVKFSDVAHFPSFSTVSWNFAPRPCRVTGLLEDHLVCCLVHVLKRA